MESEEEDAEDSDPGIGNGMDKDRPATEPPVLKPMPKRQSVADLRAKLHTRIEELRKGRKAAPYMERSPKEHLLEEQRQAREEAHWNAAKTEQQNKKQKPQRVCASVPNGVSGAN